MERGRAVGDADCESLVSTLALTVTSGQGMLGKNSVRENSGSLFTYMD